jgi:hypothetical protein
LLNDRIIERAFYAVAAAWAALIFAGWPVAAALSGGAPATSVFGVGEEAFSVLTNWLPLAVDVAQGNLLPLTPSLAAEQSGLSIYPYITLWLHGLLIALFGPNGAAVVGGVVWPSLSFILLVMLFRRYLPRRWSVSLAAVATISFVDLPLREFIIGIAQGVGWRQLGVASPPDLAHFPMPSLTIALFLAVLLLSLDRKRLGARRLTLITVLWALQTQVHAVNAAIGLIFWFSHFPIELARLQRGNIDRRYVFRVAVQALVALAVSAPAIAGWLGLSLESLDYLKRGHLAPSGMFGGYYYFAYFLLPLILTALLYLITRLDYYELATRFRPVYGLMLVEFVLVTFNTVTGRGLPADSLFLRLALYVLHPLYYVPIIHLLTRISADQPTGPSSLGMESSSPAITVRRAMHWFVADASKFYLPLLLIVLTAYAMASAQMTWRLAGSANAARNSRAIAHMEAALKDAGPNDTVATRLASSNILISSTGRAGSLWPSRFANDISKEKIVARLALYARLAAWSEADFQEFMAARELRDLMPLRLSDAGVPHGVGYWIAYHREMPRTAEERSRHRLAVSKAFSDVEINRDACRFGLTRWHSRLPPPHGLEVKETLETPLGFLYILPRSPRLGTMGDCPKDR